MNGEFLLTTPELIQEVEILLAGMPGWTPLTYKALMARYRMKNGDAFRVNRKWGWNMRFASRRAQ